MLLDTPVCDFGWPAPGFTLKTPEGATHSLSDHAGKPVLVTFICNHCPYVVAVADRLAADARVLMDEGIAVLAVMSNDWRDYPADAPGRMTEFAARHGFPFPYLVDEGQAVGRAWGAICTPDFFGLNAEHRLQYRGRLDDAGRGDASGRVPELLNAMQQIAETGEGPRDQVPSMGCSIKWS
ncbi:thioredoxin family protein [Jannaschia marina]|uniref:thioredoxin family protein n=1 Tax=Jannaschia marina TaxID=2741674 RepID=UPI0015CCCF59|nr:thioredoxin family protein [Jannaschia marina]